MAPQTTAEAAGATSSAPRATVIVKIDDIDATIRPYIWHIVSSDVGITGEPIRIMVNPILIIGVIKGILECVKLANDIFGSKDDSLPGWAAQISQKLDYEIALTEEVLKELKDLVPELLQGFEKLLNEQVRERIGSGLTNAEVVFAGIKPGIPLSNEQKALAVNAYTQVTDPSYLLMNCGFPWATNIAEGMLTAVGLLKVLQIPKEQIDKQIDITVRYLEKCINPTLPNSIPVTSKKILNTAAQNKERLNKEVSDYLIGCARVGSYPTTAGIGDFPHFPPPLYPVLGNLGGSFDEGYHGAVPNWNHGIIRTSRPDIVYVTTSDLNIENAWKWRNSYNFWDYNTFQKAAGKLDAIISVMQNERAVAIAQINTVAQLAALSQNIQELIVAFNDLKKA
jgi:hypothetical protein